MLEAILKQNEKHRLLIGAKYAELFDNFIKTYPRITENTFIYSEKRNNYIYKELNAYVLSLNGANGKG